MRTDIEERWRNFFFYFFFFSRFSLRYTEIGPSEFVGARTKRLYLTRATHENQKHEISPSFQLKFEKSYVFGFSQIYGFLTVRIGRSVTLSVNCMLQHCYPYKHIYLSNYPVISRQSILLCFLNNLSNIKTHISYT